MSTHEHMEQENQSQGSWLTWRVGFVVAGFLVIAGFLLFEEHRAHVLGALIYLPLLICPLMHLFMHGGHGSHARHDRERRDS